MLDSLKFRRPFSGCEEKMTPERSYRNSHNRLVETALAYYVTIPILLCSASEGVWQAAAHERYMTKPEHEANLETAYVKNVLDPTRLCVR